MKQWVDLPDGSKVFRDGDRDLASVYQDGRSRWIAEWGLSSSKKWNSEAEAKACIEIIFA